MSSNGTVNPNAPAPEVLDPENDLVVLQPSQIGGLLKAEIDMQIATAKAYPRAVSTILKESEDMACIDQETAKSMYYRIPRGGKQIEGASIRLAEIMASTWGNLRVQARIVESSEDFVTVQAVCHDLERNTAVSIEKRRRVTKKKNAPRADADDIQIAGLAGMSIALRDAVFKIVPRVYVDRIMRRAQLVAAGAQKSVGEARKNWLGYFAKLKIKPQQVYDALGVVGEEDIGIEELITMSGWDTALKQGEATLTTIFAPQEEEVPSGNESTLKKMKDKDAAKTTATVTTPTQESRPNEDTSTEASIAAADKMKPPVTKPAPEKKPEPVKETPKPASKPEPTPQPKPVKQPEPTPPPVEPTTEVDADSESTEDDGSEEAPEWYTKWMTTFNDYTMKTWELAKRGLGSLVTQLKEEVNQPYKPLYEELVKKWASKMAEIVDKPSMMLVVESTFKTVEKYVHASVYAYGVKVLADKKASLPS